MDRVHQVVERSSPHYSGEVTPLDRAKQPALAVAGDLRKEAKTGFAQPQTRFRTPNPTGKAGILTTLHECCVQSKPQKAAEICPGFHTTPRTHGTTAATHSLHDCTEVSDLGNECCKTAASR